MENLLFQLLPKAPNSIWLRYGITVAIIGVTTVLRYSLDPVLRNYPFLLYIPAIFLVSLLFDRASGFLAVILSGFLIIWLFIEPRGVLWISDHGDRIAFIIYMGLGLGIAAVTEALRKTLEALHQAWEKVAAADREKDLMLQEVHHRIRNDLQQISAQLSMAALSRENCPAAMDGTIERIGVLSRVYGRLRRIDDASIVNAREFLESLVEDLQQGMVGLRPIALSARADSVDLDVRTAVAVGTIANELVTNAVKYAFPDTQPGWVDLRFRCEEDDCLLIVSDNGVGLTSTHPKGTGLGRQIMGQLAAQLRGKLEVRPRPEGGVQATLRFPVPSYAKITAGYENS
jgi:two-component sensor histidine kinase